ncbi:hypothetical protein C4D60_Mb02t08400 [Musa balbisiana]|uniref:Uncharacterized protein n=1 Tax=Musa balbisiana TaxID=52838 RepID=A0A4S8IAK0_MUSBA|nr:hypothetical protein C4D60_Mb02t08400 [Musa balbisiana]
MPIAGHLYRFNLESLISTLLWPASLVIVVAFTAFRESPYGDATAASASATFYHGDGGDDPETSSLDGSTPSMEACGHLRTVVRPLA